jgi:hypothetical protein
MVIPSIALVSMLLLAGPPGPAAARCAGKLSGAAEGAFECTVSVRAGEEGQALFVIEAHAPIPGVPAYSPGSFEIPLPVKAKTYTLDSLGQGVASVAAEGGTLYTAAKTFGRRGEVDVVFTTVKADPATKDAWEVHGSYRARLLPVGSGKRGEVVVEVTF